MVLALQGPYISPKDWQNLGPFPLFFWNKKKPLKDIGLDMWSLWPFSISSNLAALTSARFSCTGLEHSPDLGAICRIPSNSSLRQDDVLLFPRGWKNYKGSFLSPTPFCVLPAPSPPQHFLHPPPGPGLAVSSLLKNHSFLPCSPCLLLRTSEAQEVIQFNLPIL